MYAHGSTLLDYFPIRYGTPSNFKQRKKIQARHIIIIVFVGRASTYVDYFFVKIMVLTSVSKPEQL